MQPMSTIKMKAIAFMLVIDIAWLYFVIGKPFARLIGGIQGSPMQLRAAGAAVAYASMAGLVAVFLPKARTLTEAFALGAFVYGVYDGTNYATFKAWDPKLALLDTLWGGVLFALTKAFMNIS